jgi:hypothetical protein
MTQILSMLCNHAIIRIFDSLSVSEASFLEFDPMHGAMSQKLGVESGFCGRLFDFNMPSILVL